MSLRTGWLRASLILRKSPLIQSNVRFASTYDDQFKSIVVPFLDNILTSPVHTIHEAYPTFASSMKETEFPEQLHLSKQLALKCDRDVSAILESLAASGRPPDLQRIEDILEDMPRVFFRNPSPKHHASVLRGLVKRGDIPEVLRWLRNMEEKPPYQPPSLSQYHQLISSSISFQLTQSLVTTMRPTNCKPTIETYKIVMQSLDKLSLQQPLEEIVSDLIQDIRQEGIPHDPAIPALLSEIIPSPDAVIAKYNHLIPPSPSQNPQHTFDQAFAIRISTAASEGGLSAALKVYHEYLQAGGRPSQFMFKALLRSSTSVNDIDRVQQVLGLKPTINPWSLVMFNNTRHGNLIDAVEIYKEAKRRGLTPGASFVEPLVKSLCRRPTDANIDHAIALYDDLAHNASVSDNQTESYAKQDQVPDAHIFLSLFRGLARSTNSRKSREIAESLLRDMKARGFSLRAITPYRIAVQMKSARNEEEAFEAYRSLENELDQDGYAIVLDAFSRLTFQDDTLPSAHLYFDIVRDMRIREMPVTEVVYTTLLRQIAKLTASVVKTTSGEAEVFLERLARITRHTHDLITLDASISPDAALWNQLMDTYQRQGHFADACRVWDQMYLSGRYNDASVCIILDACGVNQSWPMALRIHDRLIRDGFPLSRNGWHSWIECLCRMRRINDAVKVVCLDMGKGQKDMAPNVETVRLVISFARKHNLHRQVSQRIQRFLPELWHSIPEDLKYID
ncbi:pentatricopeptide repeat-containing protein [Mycena floridula]|nr:pentatricopeptide repeat-containing protein [Mycena floridula]